MWINGRKWEELRTWQRNQEREVEELRRKLDRILDQLEPWQLQMEDLSEKARTAIRRLSKRVEDATRVDQGAAVTDGTAPRQTDQITAAIHARRSRGA